MSGPVRTACLVLASAWLLASHAIAGHVIVVDPNGGGDYFRIQRAVDEAVDGDTILVKGGAYPGFTIMDKRVYVVAENGHPVTVNGTVSVMNLAASRDVVIAGLTVHGSGHGLYLAANAGSVRVQACSIFASSLAGPQQHGAFVASCSDVAFSACVLEGGVGYYLSGSGLRLVNGSNVALYDCTARGAGGATQPPFCPNGNQGGWGGNGAYVSSSFLFASGSGFHGGLGGSARSDCFFSGDGGGGGYGMWAESGSEARTLGCTFTAGQGGGAGCGDFGICGNPGNSPPPTAVIGGATWMTFPGSARKLTMPYLVREPPATVPVSAQGQEGDQIFLCVSRQTSFQYVANQSGVRTTPLSPPPVVTDIGTLPPAGVVLNTTIPSYDLGGAVESRAYFFQTVHKLPSGQRILGSPANLIVVDSAF